ncbi:MAG: hypothetical protein ABI717_05925 [Actinomycetota bacterium]
MTGDVLLVLGAALATGVEAVEAATIVLALGMSRGWRAPLLGSAAALGVLAAATVAVGPALERIPIDSLRLVVGTLVLLFGLQWLRKAILREAGVLSKHDESAAFAQEVERARETGRARGPLDRYSWTLAFKSVLLEGLEVVFIVLTLGVNQGSIPLAATGAVVAAVVVGGAAVLVRRPLSRVPENALKFGVGVMLTAFGTFWAAEGAGAEWPGGDAALLALVAITAAWSLLFVRVVRVRTA